MMIRVNSISTQALQGRNFPKSFVSLRKEGGSSLIEPTLDALHSQTAAMQEEVDLVDPPYALLNGANLASVLSEIYRILEPGGKVCINTRLTDPEGNRRSLADHWLKEAPSECRRPPRAEELTRRMSEAGFESAQLQEEPSPAPCGKMIVVAVKPGAERART